MKLYYSPGACSMATHIALTESGLKYSTEAVDLKTHTYKGGDYYKINPKGYVPALELDGGEILTEVAVVLQYIADKAPGKNLTPKHGTLEHYRCQEWLNFIATEVHKNFGPLWDPKSSDETKASAKGRLEKRFDYISTQLKGKTYLMGESYCVADAYLFTVLGWTKPLKFDLTKWPALMGYMEKVKSRPATMETMKSEGLLK